MQNKNLTELCFGLIRKGAQRFRLYPKPEKLRSMLAILQTDNDLYNERMGETIGWIIGAVLLILAIAWLVKRFRKG